MEKQTRKISAKEILADIKAGTDDRALMEKYQLTENRLQNILKKLLDSGVLKQQDLNNRISVPEKSAGVAWECPACGKPQIKAMDECPNCGAIRAKFRENKAMGTSQNLSNETSNETEEPAMPDNFGFMKKAKKAFLDEAYSRGLWKFRVTYLNFVLTLVAILLLIQVGIGLGMIGHRVQEFHVKSASGNAPLQRVHIESVSENLPLQRVHIDSVSGNLPVTIKAPLSFGGNVCAGQCGNF